MSATTTTPRSSPSQPTSTASCCLGGVVGTVEGVVEDCRRGRRHSRRERRRPTSTPPVDLAAGTTLRALSKPATVASRSPRRRPRQRSPHRSDARRRAPAMHWSWSNSPASVPGLDARRRGSSPRSSPCRSCRGRLCRPCVSTPGCPALDDDPELGTATGADHDRRRCGQAELPVRQAMISTATAAVKATDADSPAISQNAMVAMAMAMTAGTNTAATRSARRCTGALLAWASWTSAAIWASLVSAPTRTAPRRAGRRR